MRYKRCCLLVACLELGLGDVLGLHALFTVGRLIGDLLAAFLLTLGFTCNKKHHLLPGGASVATKLIFDRFFSVLGLGARTGSRKLEKNLDPVDGGYQERSASTYPTLYSIINTGAGPLEEADPLLEAVLAPE